MRFGVFYELSVPRPWTAESERTVYMNALEQVRVADEMGFHSVWAVEHHFLEEYSHSSAPELFLTACAMQTKQIRVGHGIVICVPEFNHPVKIAERAAVLDILSGGRLEFGTGRSATWTELGGFRANPDTTKNSWDEFVHTIPQMWMQERFSHEGAYFSIEDSHVVPFRRTPYRIYLGGTSDHTYRLAAENGWGVAVPPLLPYSVLEQQLDVYRDSCAKAGTTPDIVWIHACHIDEDRDTALREGEQWVPQFIQGNCSPLTEWPKPPTEGLQAAGYGFYASGIMERLATVPYEQLIEDDYVWVGTPDALGVVSLPSSRTGGTPSIKLRISSPVRVSYSSSALAMVCSPSMCSRITRCAVW